jgi:FixJ family two-component response regulator
MPGMSGTDLQAELQRRNCMLPIIFLTGHGDIPMAVEAMRAGALDFMPKPFRESELLDSIELAFQHQHKIVDKYALYTSIAKRIDNLTPREKDVMNRIVEGQSSKVIAINLSLSPRTVEAHRAHIMEKMQTRSLADLVRTVMLSEQMKREA